MTLASVVDQPLRRVRAFPNLARVVDAGRTARAASRLWRTTVASLAALGEAKLSGFRTPGERAGALSRLAAEVLAIHGVEVEPVGVVPERPCLLVANHVSHLDPLVVLAHIPAVPIVRAEVAAWPVFGTAAAALGARFAAAGDPLGRARVLRGVLGALRNGVPVLNFPEVSAPRNIAARLSLRESLTGAEGDIGARDRVERFHRGGFGLAILADLPVVPIALAIDPDDDAEGERGVAARGGPRFWRWSTRARTRVKMIVRAPMWGRPGEQADDFAVRVRTAIALALDPPRTRHAAR